MIKRSVQWMIILTILVVSFGSVKSAGASSSCGSQVTVQWGDTLSGIAVKCGTTMDAIRASNPGLGWWVYAGQVLYMPTGNAGNPPPASGGTYTIRAGDTLGNIAVRTGCSLSALLAVNPQIVNPSIIYVGQVINLPSGAKPPATPPPACNCPPGSQPGSSLDSYLTLKIAYEYGLFVRVEPGGKIISSGRNNSSWLYDPTSVMTDGKGKVWVKVHLYPAVKGYSSGWMLVRDQQGKFFTSPALP